LLKQAGLQYLVAGETIKAHECRALADLFEGRFRDAGDNFKKAGLIEKSIDAYWRGKLYKNIAECATANPDFAKLPRCRVAAHIDSRSQTLRECRSLCEQLLENAKVNEGLRIDLRSALWKDSLHEAVQKSVEGKDKIKIELNQDEAGTLPNFCSVQLARNGLPLHAMAIARYPATHKVLQATSFILVQLYLYFVFALDRFLTAS